MQILLEIVDVITKYNIWNLKPINIMLYFWGVVVVVVKIIL